MSYRHMEMSSQNVGGIDLYCIGASGEEAIEKLVQESFHDVTLVGEQMAHGSSHMFLLPILKLSVRISGWRWTWRRDDMAVDRSYSAESATVAADWRPV